MYQQMRNNLREIDLLRAHSVSMDMNGKQKMTCSSNTSNSFNSMQEEGEAKFPTSRSGVARRTANGIDVISSNAAIGTNNQRYLMSDPAQPIGEEKTSLKRTISQSIEPDNDLHNEEFPGMLPVSQKNSSGSTKYLSSWDLMMAKRLEAQETNYQERKR
ncbi:predicted protein [Chaetoceros tenuissimus]|uniref:Uncharacterized protein n=1 Tax=Chaetoceros tenuissimus TaxID=426638 RepID=A0AAD3H7J6_9STRA|nr:predicted protein [Chaetoceros tenuissimus]